MSIRSTSQNLKFSYLINQQDHDKKSYRTKCITYQIWPHMHLSHKPVHQCTVFNRHSSLRCCANSKGKYFGESNSTKKTSLRDENRLNFIKEITHPVNKQI